jgi:hypothetical protein
MAAAALSSILLVESNKENERRKEKTEGIELTSHPNSYAKSTSYCHRTKVISNEI